MSLLLERSLFCLPVATSMGTLDHIEHFIGFDKSTGEYRMARYLKNYVIESFILLLLSWMVVYAKIQLHFYFLTMKTADYVHQP